MVRVFGDFAMLGKIDEEYRLPLVPMNHKNGEALRCMLKHCAILK